MRSRFVLSEVAADLRRNIAMTMAMILTAAISLALLGASFLIFRQVGEMQDYYASRVGVSIFLKDGITDDQRNQLQASLKGNPLVVSVAYQSKEAAYAEFRENFRDSPDLLAQVTPTQLPASFRVKLKDPTLFVTALGSYASRPGVDQIVDQRRLIQNIFDTFGTLRLGATAIAIVEAIAAVLLITNMIQVAAYSRRREVAVMRLVGASHFFVQLPFVLFATVAGTIGAVLGWLVLLGSKFFLVDNLFGVNGINGVIPTWDLIGLIQALGLMIVAGGLVSALVGWLTIRLQTRY
ncbi:permease-like cell division protein FtsX [Fodinicola acaciae]|uniref:permease-like cell division protein FtsX n=1 Tax=Fodinicola acaciae TaxID=2681555 RepID=UPI0013D3CBF2|nr:permease-like cell division protein FtsX [Fodinicola acaciae]